MSKQVGPTSREQVGLTSWEMLLFVFSEQSFTLPHGTQPGSHTSRTPQGPRARSLKDSGLSE